MSNPAPTTIFRTVTDPDHPKTRLRVVGELVTMLRRRRNEEMRPREFLTEREVDRLIPAAKKRGRYGQRDATAILICFRHGLRASELCGLRWDQIDFAAADIHVRR
jgi:integrase